MRGLSLLWLLALLWLLFATQPTWAHSILESAEPAPGSQLIASPQQIILNFSTPLSTTSTFALYTTDFQFVAGVVPIFDPQAPLQLIAALPRLPPNTYTVQWTAVSIDGDLISGSYNFGVSVAASNRWSLLQVGAFVVVVVLCVLLGAFGRSVLDRP